MLAIWECVGAISWVEEDHSFFRNLMVRTGMLGRIWLHTWFVLHLWLPERIRSAVDPARFTNVASRTDPFYAWWLIIRADREFYRMFM